MHTYTRREIAGTVLLFVAGCALGPGVWRMLAHGDARLLALPALGTLAAVSVLVAAIFLALGLAQAWLTRGRMQGFIVVGVIVAMTGGALVRRLLALPFVVAVVPGDVSADSLYESMIFSGAIVAIIAVVIRARTTPELTDAEIEAELPLVPLHPGLPPNYQVLVYDGDCAFCARCVQFILDRDDRNTLYFASRRSAFGVALEARHPDLKSVSSVLWVTGDDMLGEFVSTRWSAVHHMGQYLGGVWEQLTRFADYLVPIRILDGGYALIAAIRHRLTAGVTCRVPTPDDRRRLLA